jgi:hypothetical protein
MSTNSHNDGKCLSAMSPSTISLHLIQCLESGPKDLIKLISSHQAFENTSTSVAASQMRNALNALQDSVTDPTQKKVSSRIPKAWDYVNIL